VTAGASDLSGVPSVDPDDLRGAMRLYPTGVALLMTGTGEQLETTTVNSLVSVSLEPALVLVSIRAGARAQPVIAATGAFSVSILAADQEALSATFARRDRPSGSAAADVLSLRTDGDGRSMVAGALITIHCVAHAQHRAGDHVLHVGRVVAICRGNGRRPLIFHSGRCAGLT
jgi:flavin reductase (DIM6/NTAB) family NADH-FMN oxidoreductase RutF